MLVLSRKLGEKVVIDPNGPKPITITVVDIDRGKIRLGIHADNDVKIYREELLKEQAERRAEEAEFEEARKLLKF